MKKITVPADGVSKPFSVSGLALYIFQAASYESLEDSPRISFEGPGLDWPAETGDVIPYDDCGFTEITVTGTAASAGDLLFVQGLDVCAEAYKTYNRGQLQKSIAGTTFSKAASDAVQQFSDLELAGPSSNLPKRIYIWVAGGATRGINYAFNADPSQGYPVTDAMYWDNDQSNNGANERTAIEPLEIVGIDWIQKFRFIASVAGETPNLITTPEY